MASKVNDIIEEGWPVPDDVTAFADEDGDVAVLGADGWACFDRDQNRDQAPYYGVKPDVNAARGWAAGRLTVTAVREPEPGALRDLVSGWVHSDGTTCAEYLAPADDRQWWCTTHEMHVRRPSVAAEPERKVERAGWPGDGDPVVVAVREAKVGDVIEWAEPIPANVLLLTDTATDKWHRTSTRPLMFSWGGRPLSVDAMRESRRWWPMTVAEVEAPVLLDLVRQYGDRRGEVHEKYGPWLTDAEQEIRALFDRIAALVPQPDVEVERLQRLLKTQASNFVAATDKLIAERDEARGRVELLEADLDALANEPATPDPSVLSLPSVPDGAVALIGVRSGRRYVRAAEGKWLNGVGNAPVRLGTVMAVEESVTVVMREPRTWPKLDDAPTDLPAVRGASGRVWRPHDGSPDAMWFWIDTDGRELGFEPFPTVQYIDGPLTEVFDDEPGGAR